jgi:hypothetical protein
VARLLLFNSVVEGQTQSPGRVCGTASPHPDQGLIHRPTKMEVTAVVHQTVLRFRAEVAGTNQRGTALDEGKRLPSRICVEARWKQSFFRTRRLRKGESWTEPLAFVPGAPLSRRLRSSDLIEHHPPFLPGTHFARLERGDFVLEDRLGTKEGRAQLRNKLLRRIEPVDSETSSASTT